ncbi:hypothetical protein STEG23_018247 [Scotinomys teguina]
MDHVPTGKPQFPPSSNRPDGRCPRTPAAAQTRYPPDLWLWQQRLLDNPTWQLGRGDADAVKRVERRFLICKMKFSSQR